MVTSIGQIRVIKSMDPNINPYNAPQPIPEDRGILLGLWVGGHPTPGYTFWRMPAEGGATILETPDEVPQSEKDYYWDQDGLEKSIQGAHRPNLIGEMDFNAALRCRHALLERGERYIPAVWALSVRMRRLLLDPPVPREFNYLKRQGTTVKNPPYLITDAFCDGKRLPCYDLPLGVLDLWGDADELEYVFYRLEGPQWLREHEGSVLELIVMHDMQETTVVRTDGVWKKAAA